MRLLGAIILVHGALVFGAPARDVRQFTVVVPGTSAPKTLEYLSIKPKFHLQLVSPHPYKNPRRESNTWAGLELRSLLKNELSQGLNREVVISGASGYSAQITEEDVRKHSIIVADQRDGNPLKPEDGGPQLVFPLQDSTLPEPLRSDAWWVWYVSGIFVGYPEPRLAVVRKGRKANQELSQVKENFIESISPCYPAGQRMVPPPKGNVKTSLVPISALATGGGKIDKIRVHNHLGGSVEIDRDLDKYVLAYSWNGETIKPSFGGPIQLVRRGPNPSCFYFVNRIEL